MYIGLNHVGKESKTKMIVRDKKRVLSWHPLVESMKGMIGEKPADFTLLGLIWASTSITPSLFC